jgi:phosphatidylserine/phosphatidylglycerophosphate/cardiolipin synthase-like enzyme
MSPVLELSRSLRPAFTRDRGRELAPATRRAWLCWIALLLAGCGGRAGTASGGGASSSAAAAPPAVELVESAPVETTLDHPELPNAAEVWLEMIGGARRSIDLAQFYASNQPGSRLEPVVAALEAALARGVRVRFLAEQKFVTVYPDTLERLARAGAIVRHYDLTSAGGGILHAKYFVVDEREAFLGSQNFDWRALEHIYELGARLRQPAAVGALAAIFAADWAYAGGEPAPTAAAPAPTPGLELVASPQRSLPAGVAWDLPRLVALIDGATSSVEVELLTYRADASGAPWDELEAPLVRAAARGIKVRLLLSDWSKRAKTLAGLQRLARASKIELRLLTIPAWTGGFIPFARVAHAKLMIVDGVRGWVGTSNWERDYFYQSRNVGLLVEDRGVAAQLAAFFATAWGSPYAAAFDPEAAYEAPRVE